MNSAKTLIIIVGPTAVGKTDLCVKIAKLLDTEVVSADSRQFYRELAIGTAKPTTEEMDGVKHHFIDSHSIQDYYSVGDFERDCLMVLEEIFQRKDVAILTGGSGMFIKMITDGIDEMPEADLILRQQLAERLENEGLEVLANELKNLDPTYYAQVDTQNTQRILRALEVCMATGKPFSSFRKNQKVERPFKMIKIALERPREELYARIDQRMDIMLANGLEAEAKAVIAFKEHYALKTVGYREIYEHLDGNYDRDEMIRLLKRNSRRYAKRQMTWFKNQDEFEWFDAKNEGEILNFIQKQMEL
ncbi:MAG: tRNA (adenosine(37)-N6)-dimethylallyltransferase MiaA [Arcicella sp.]|jgi:tRNA dimethylallyltransferase|nr:tRNA (adenosine(37)-N6)-dimethylallyltransferase MiaA [Arcicella sp.]